MSSIYKIFFDPTSADTIESSSSIGAFIRAGIDGELIDSTSNALHVLFTNTSIAVTATDLDIRDLSSTTDSVSAVQSGIWTIDSITNAVSIIDGGNSITVDAVDFDIRGISAASDSISSWLKDGTGTAITSTLVGSSQGLDVNVLNTDLSVNDAALANAALTASKHAANDVASSLIAAPLAERKYLYVYNNSGQTIYLGGTGVTSTTGFPVFPGSMLDARAGSSIDFKVICASGKVAQDIRCLELA